MLGGAGDAPVVLLPQTLDNLNQELAKVEDLARKKRQQLETAKKYHQFNANIDEEDAWVGWIRFESQILSYPYSIHTP